MEVEKGIKAREERSEGEKELLYYRARHYSLLSLRLKLSYQNRLELSVGNEVLRVADDRRLVSSIPLRERSVSGY